MEALEYRVHILLLNTVSSHTFNLHNYKLRVSRTIAYVHFKAPFESFTNMQDLGTNNKSGRTCTMTCENPLDK